MITIKLAKGLVKGDNILFADAGVLTAAAVEKVESFKTAKGEGMMEVRYRYNHDIRIHILPENQPVFVWGNLE